MFNYDSSSLVSDLSFAIFFDVFQIDGKGMELSFFDLFPINGDFLLASFDLIAVGDGSSSFGFRDTLFSNSLF